MSDSLNVWNSYSDAQKREIRSACVFVALGPSIRANIGEIVSVFKSVIEGEINKLKYKGKLSVDEEKLLQFLKEAASVSGDISGLKKLEELTKRAENMSMGQLMPILKKCWDRAPSVMKFPGFAALLQQRAIGKFADFAVHWHYSVNNSYDPPKGMSEPFSGYDDIINSLMGHPLCRKKMAEEAAKWEAENERRKRGN